MKILGICASPRGEKSQTLRLCRALLEGASSAGAETELVDLCRLNIEYCNACTVCFSTGECVKEDDFTDLLPKILGCDGLVLASPNYFHSVTAQMKAMIDRMADVVHCQMLTGKYGCSVATAGGPASQEVNDCQNTLLLGFGCSVVGSVGASPSIPGSMETALTKAPLLGKELVKAIEEGRSYPEQDHIHKEMRARMCNLVTTNRDLWPHEYQYWSSKGWL